MDSDDEKQTKIVLYSGFKEKQSIQYNPTGHPFYISGFPPKFISENRNLDTCVADLGAGVKWWSVRSDISGLSIPVLPPKPRKH